MNIFNKFFEAILGKDIDGMDIKEIKGENQLINDEYNFKKIQKNLFIINNFSSVKFYNEEFTFKTFKKKKTEFISVDIGENTEAIIPKIRYVFYKNKKSQKNCY